MDRRSRAGDPGAAAAPAPGGLHRPRARADPRQAPRDGPLRQVAGGGGGRPRRELPSARRAPEGRGGEHGGDRLRPALRQAAGPDGRAIVDDHARTTDILPTIADILGVEVPWKTDGRSFLAGGGDGPDVRVGTSSGDVVVGDDEELVERRAGPRAPDRPFRRGRRRAGLFGIGLSRLARASARRARRGGQRRPDVRELRRERLRPGGALRPGAPMGGSQGRPPGRRSPWRSTGASSPSRGSFEHDGDTLVSAVTPEDAYRTGANSVRVFVVQVSDDGPPGARAGLLTLIARVIHSTSAMAS